MRSKVKQACRYFSAERAQQKQPDFPPSVHTCADVIQQEQVPAAHQQLAAGETPPLATADATGKLVAHDGVGAGLQTQQPDSKLDRQLSTVSQLD